MSVPPTLPPSPPPHVANFNDSVGSITMLPDGTILCRYRAAVPDEVILEGVIIYKPDAPGYEGLLRFIGGLKPGESKPMPRIGPAGDVPNH